MPTRMHDDEFEVTEPLVRALLSDQMSEFANQPLAVVEPWGTNNAVWRLGDEFLVRFARIPSAEHEINHDVEWLPRLAPLLSVQIPEVVEVGAPAFGYPYRWAVYRWVPGVGASRDEMNDPVEFSLALAQFVRELVAVPADGGPPATNRARPLAEYDAVTRAAIANASHLIDADAALSVWEKALAAPAYDGPSVWVHGDLEGNCVVEQGVLSGVVDWGSSCVGDPAVDVQVVWSPLFTEASRELFLDSLNIDDATLERSRGMAINQACLALPYYLNTYPLIVERSWHKLAALGVSSVAA